MIPYTLYREDLATLETVWDGAFHRSIPPPVPVEPVVPPVSEYALRLLEYVTTDWQKSMEIAARSGVTRSTVRDYLQILYRHGLVERMTLRNPRGAPYACYRVSQ